ncbi:MAG: PIN domain nuclease [Dehalococcoidia bacterium]|nr:PIN domain nuclease [Dehalococcoidia bacterium]
MSIEFIFRILAMILFGFGGWTLGIAIGGESASPEYMRWVLSLTLSGSALGLLLAPYFTTRPFRWIIRQIRQIPAQDLMAGTIGLIVGLVISALLALPLSMLPGNFGEILPFVVSMFLGYFSIAIMVMRERELFNVLSSRLGGTVTAEPKPSPRNNYIILDTSAIIDGRIADISQTGFIQGTFLIPRFVLAELQHIADSADILRRNRGRRGLDMLNKLQKDSVVPIQILDVEMEDVHEVDGKLVKLAKSMRAPIITTDFNLNRVAEIQGVKVYNINELANAVKSVVLPGEEMMVRIIQEGKEMGQGVGYLEDGTMVVVEGGRRHLNAQLDIVVTRVLQTVAGRMIFAQTKNGAIERGT